MYRFAIFGTVLLTAGAASGQGTRQDYLRAELFAAQFPGMVYNVPSPPEWIDGGPSYWYRVDRAMGTEFIIVDPVKGKKTPAFDHTKLAVGLAKVSIEKVEATNLPFWHIRLAGTKVRFHAFEKNWDFDTVTGVVGESIGPWPGVVIKGKPHPDSLRSPFGHHAISPDGKWEASIDEAYNLTIKNRDTDVLQVLTGDCSERFYFDAEFYWSPDSSKIMGFCVWEVKAKKVTLVESKPVDKFLPRVVKFDQPKPGDKISQRAPRLFRVRDCQEIPISDLFFTNAFEAIHPRWAPDSLRFTFLHNPRGHQFLRLVSVDAETGLTHVLFEETSKTFVDYSNKLYYSPLDATNEILWMSERDGWNHLYLLHAKNGKVKNPITKGEWLIRRVDRVDAEARTIWFWAHGVVPKQDPYHLHYCRCNLDGTGLVVLTEGDGTHEIWQTPDRQFFIDQYSRVDKPPVTELRRLDDGKLVMQLELGSVEDIEVLGWKAPERFVAKGRDGKTDIHGLIFRPTNFDSKKKYPVVEEIYAGPTEFHVPKRFSAVHQPLQNIVEVGFIGVMIDGMGSNWRNKAFHDVCWKNLGDAGLPDHIAWLQAAAKKYPEMDLTRVGIYGGSAGGRNAVRAIIAHNDFYKVAVADCGNHDDRMYHAWYGELWMGYPVGPQYLFQSNITKAHHLQGKLLLTVGELDRNVDPANTLRLVDALTKADKEFEMYFAPGVGHGAAEYPAGSRRRTDFLVRHLLGVEPRR